MKTYTDFSGYLLPSLLCTSKTKFPIQKARLTWNISSSSVVSGTIPWIPAMVIALLVAHSFQTRVPQSVVDLVLFGIAPARRPRHRSLVHLNAQPFLSKQEETIA